MSEEQIEAQPTMELRFIVRDGQRVLQQKYAITRKEPGSAYVQVGAEWRDVPCSYKE